MTKTSDVERFGDPELLKVPRSLRRKPMTRKELEVYRKRQLKAGQDERRKLDKKRASWRGPNATQRKALKYFGWSDVQINRLNETEVTYHIEARNAPAARFGAPRLLSSSEQRTLKGEGTMSTKTDKKGPAKARGKTNSTSPGKPVVKRGTGVGALITDLIMEGKTDDQVRAGVAKRFGDDAKAVTKPNHIPWYRGKLKRDGRNPPEQPKVKKAAKAAAPKKAAPKKAAAKKASAKKAAAKKAGKATGKKAGKATGTEQAALVA